MNLYILKKLGFSLFFAGVFALNSSAQIVQPAIYGDFLITGATLYTVTQGEIEADLLVEKGRIAAIGFDLEVNEGVQIIDATGKRVYPGFIDAGTRLGLSEIGSVSLTRDFNERGNLVPYVQALTAINPNGVPIAVTRVSGVTTVVSAPSGGLFPGTAAAIHLLGYTPDQMYAGSKAVLLNFPNKGRSGSWDRRSDEKREEEYKENMEKLGDFWKEAERYHQLKSKGKLENQTNPPLDALQAVFQKKYPLFIEVNRAPDILEALKWAKDKDIRVVLTGVAEGWRVASEIAKSGFPVITGPVLQTPSRAYDRYDTPYTNPSQMKAAGVTVALRTNETENVRNLPFNAGYAASYGMGIDEALRAITIVPAQILGIEDEVGSLEVGKLANLFISNGDPFEPRVQIERVFIKGWDVPMESRHTQLYQQFLERSPGLQLNE
nr:amidohydrolase family protein [Saprospiraceae bacterium]